MIDFQNIKHTTAGLECHYLGQRRSGDQVLHRFAVVNLSSETIVYYDEQGQRLDYVGGGRWEVSQGGHRIIEQKPPKIVEVTRLVGLFTDSRGQHHLALANEMQELRAYNYLAINQHTFRFEVPND